jgi:hypothetical protein
MRLEIAPLAEKLHHISEASARQAAATSALQEEVHHINEALARQAAATGALQDTVMQQTAAIEGMMDACQMSTASKAKHLFKFEALESDPPMVKASDKRVSRLVELLVQARSQSRREPKNFTSDEKWCRGEHMILFFGNVAREYGVGTIEPNESIYELKVLIGGKMFTGKTHLFVGGEKALLDSEHALILVIEMKPFTGPCALTGNGFSREDFKHQAQIALQSAAIQSCCLGSRPFACILTNLHHMYVVQVTSYDSSQITVQTYNCVSDKAKFVRAILMAADINKGIQKRCDINRNPIMCVTNMGYDSHRADSLSSLAMGSNSQVQTNTQGPSGTGVTHQAGRALDVADSAESFLDESEALNIADGFWTLGGDDDGCEDFKRTGPVGDEEQCTSSSAEGTCTESFAKWLPREEHQRSSVRPILTWAWVHMQQHPLADCSSKLNVWSENM